MPRIQTHVLTIFAGLLLSPVSSSSQTASQKDLVAAAFESQVQNILLEAKKPVSGLPLFSEISIKIDSIKVDEDRAQAAGTISARCNYDAALADINCKKGVLVRLAVETKSFYVKESGWLVKSYTFKQATSLTESLLATRTTLARPSAIPGVKWQRSNAEMLQSVQNELRNFYKISDAQIGPFIVGDVLEFASIRTSSGRDLIAVNGGVKLAENQCGNDSTGTRFVGNPAKPLENLTIILVGCPPGKEIVIPPQFKNGEVLNSKGPAPVVVNVKGPMATYTVRDGDKVIALVRVAQ